MRYLTVINGVGEYIHGGSIGVAIEKDGVAAGFVVGVETIHQRLETVVEKLSHLIDRLHTFARWNRSSG